MTSDSMCRRLLEQLVHSSHLLPSIWVSILEAVVVFRKRLPCCYSTASALQVRMLLQQLRVSRQSATGAASANVVEVVEACKTLASLFQDHPELKQLFLAEGGGVAMIEVMEERSNKVGTGWLTGPGAGRVEQGGSQRHRVASLCHSKARSSQGSATQQAQAGSRDRSPWWVPAQTDANPPVVGIAQTRPREDHTVRQHHTWVSTARAHRLASTVHDWRTWADAKEVCAQWPVRCLPCCEQQSWKSARPPAPRCLQILTDQQCRAHGRLVRFLADRVALVTSPAPACRL